MLSYLELYLASLLDMGFDLYLHIQCVLQEGKGLEERTYILDLVVASLDA